MFRFLLSFAVVIGSTTACGGVGLETLQYGSDSGVENLSGDDDDDDDDDTDPTGGDDSGPDLPTPESPSIDDLTLTEGPDSVDVVLLLSDPDDDLFGGEVVLATSSGTNRYAIPDELSSWSNNVATISLSRSDCDAGTTVSVSAYVSDAFGNDSAAVSDSLRLSGTSVSVSEVGDQWGDHDNIGGLSPGTQICGNIYQATNNGADQYTGDIDWIQFQAGQSGQYVFSMTWDDAGSDYDIALYSSTGTGIAGSVTDGTTQPESFNASLTQGESYVLRVGGWSGSPGMYVVDVP